MRFQRFRLLDAEQSQDWLDQTRATLIAGMPQPFFLATQKVVPCGP
jgi:hypothetical protein